MFQKSLERTRAGKPFVFYDGPPFATGLPHHGNLLASVLKDVIPRYWTMKGRYVERRFGWDCHGVPIEHEIDKQLGMPTHEALAKLGVAGYNAECRGIVERYVREWRQIIERLGRWVDFDNDYKTMDASYMESVWWVVKQLWDRGLIYEGEKVMPVSTVLETPLSNFEANMDVREVQDPSVTVLFQLRHDDSCIAAWTTTPWTLPSNLALCVGPDLRYVKVRETRSGRRVWLAKDRLADYQMRHELEVLDQRLGREMVGWDYEPLFPYFLEDRTRGAFVVVADEYVTAKDGTGVVQQAPSFGEDDFRVANREGIPSNRCPVSLSGRFLDPVADFEGMYIKDADRKIVAWLKERDAIFEVGAKKHRYPFCWRSGSPLIYRTVPTWFVRASAMREELAEANRHVHWVPEHLQQGRFGNWIENAIDWAISRNRVWGTPLPIWRNDLTANTKCIGSRAELRELTGSSPDDLHREFVDDLSFKCEGEPGTYRRVSEVLDCWFESGSMPYAHQHYPFECKEAFESGFPAEFVAEGLDQTRGWFYTLMVLSVGVFGLPAFRNVIVNGMVLAEDGKKMSKHMRNYTPPKTLIDIYGADAMRLYLINSALVRGVEQRFSDSGVRDMARRVLLPWYNAYSFLKIYAHADDWRASADMPTSENIHDRWILSRLQSLKLKIEREMELYHLYKVVPQLVAYIEELTNWYIRLNRARFWGEGMSEDKEWAFATLYGSLHDLTLAMAPCAPFLAEHIFHGLVQLRTASDVAESVHLCSFPEPVGELVDSELERSMERVHRVILLGRKRREDKGVGLRTPLPELVVIHRHQALLDGAKALEGTLKRELNVKNVRFDSNISAYIELRAAPNFPKLGRRLGKRMPEFKRRIEMLDSAAVQEFQDTGTVRIDGEVFTEDDLIVRQIPQEATAVVSDSEISISLACEPTEENIREGLSREVVNRIQRARKDIRLDVSDRIRVTYSGSNRLLEAVSEHSDYVAHETLAVELAPGDPNQHVVEVSGEKFVFDIEVSDGLAAGQGVL